jgi:hypothetical protein
MEATMLRTPLDYACTTVAVWIGFAVVLAYLS